MVTALACPGEAGGGTWLLGACDRVCWSRAWGLPRVLSPTASPTLETVSCDSVRN